MGDEAPKTVRMVDPQGKAHDVPLAEIPRAQSLGFAPESDDAARARMQRETTEEQWSSPGGKFVAGTFGALRGATLGGSDVLIRAIGGESALREAKEANPGLSTGTEILGAIATAGTGLPAGLAAKAGARVAQVAEGASALTKIGRGIAGGATEGALFGAGTGVSELALSKDPLTIERIASTLGSHAMFGAATGGAVGGAAKGLELGLGRARKAIDEFQNARAARDNVGSELAGMDAKQLRAARDAELEAIEAGRVPQRDEIAGQIGAHRDATKADKLWIATKGATDRELREVGKISLEADKAIDRVLRNPKALRENPGSALRALQQEEHALERLEARRLATPDELDLSKLTPDEYKAVDVYTGGEYKVVNAHLRGTKHFGEKVGPEYELSTGTTVGDTVRELDSMIERSTLPEAMTVYRGVQISKPYRVGQTIQDKGFGSVSLNRGTADGFAASTGPKGRVLELEVPAGAKALNASKAIGGAEAEFILPRGAKFEVTEVTDDLVRARLKVAGGTTSGSRAEALAKVPAALERNRALQARLAELAAAPSSARLKAIDEAREVLAAGGARGGEKTIAEQMLQGSVYSGATGLASAIPVIGPFVAPFVGAKAAKLVTEQVFGRMGKAAGDVAARGANGAKAFLEVGTKAAKVAPPIATRVLASVRYAPSSAPATESGKKAAAPAKLPELYAARAEELRSQTMYGPDGRPQMRPEARARVAGQLAGVRAADPILADRLETFLAAKIEFLASKLERRPDLPHVIADKWQPSELSMRAFARYAAAAEDPMGVVERLAHGGVTPEDAEVMRVLYPEMLASITAQISEQLPTLRQTLPYQRRLALSIFSGVPVDPALDPRVLAVLQGQFAREEGSAGGMQAPLAQPQFGSISKPKPTAAQERAAG